MRIHLASVFVADQEKALQFYTEMLGFAKKDDIPLGHHRWLTVVADDQPDGPELVLEPDEHPAVKPFKSALVEDGIPFTSFAVADVHAEHERPSRHYPCTISTRATGAKSGRYSFLLCDPNGYRAPVNFGVTGVRCTGIVVDAGRITSFSRFPAEKAGTGR